MAVPLRPSPFPSAHPPRAALHYLRRRRVVASGLGSALARPVLAQAPWPRQPVRMLLGFPPGGGLDLVARLVASNLSAALGQPVQVENRTGANGYLATESAARATDGHTLLFGNVGALAIHNALFSNTAIDPLRDMAAVAQVVEAPMVLAVSPGLPITTLGGFIAHARANPGRLAFGSNGVGSIGHLTFERLRRALGLDMTHVPYRGMAPALPDLGAGRIHAVIDPYAAIRMGEEAGQARMVAVTSAAPVPWRPDLPTIADAAGLPGFEALAWMAIMAPPAMPSDAVRRLEAEIARALSEPPLPATLLQQGLPPRFRDAAGARAFMLAERARYGALIREAGITPRD